LIENLSHRVHRGLREIGEKLRGKVGKCIKTATKRKKKCGKTMIIRGLKTEKVMMLPIGHRCWCFRKPR
jgi:hypothetical protein